MLSAAGYSHSGEITGATLLEVCARADPASQQACADLMSAARNEANASITVLEQQAGRDPFGACVPSDLDPKLFSGLVLVYLEARPQLRPLPAGAAVTQALLSAYPCN